MRLYQPSNGTEGADFMERFCFQCQRDAKFAETQEADDGCPIVAATFRYRVDDPEYPKEWIIDEAGPRCTAFIERGKELPFRCSKTIDLFGSQSGYGG